MSFRKTDSIFLYRKQGSFLTCSTGTTHLAMYALNYTKNSSLIALVYDSLSLPLHYNREYLFLSYPLYVRLKTQDKKIQGVKDFFWAWANTCFAKVCLKPERFMCHSVCENKFLHSKTQAGCGSKRLTNMYTLTLHKYQTSKYLQRKRKLYI